jgi:hypothetical protein
MAGGWTYNQWKRKPEGVVKEYAVVELSSIGSVALDLVTASLKKQ